METSISESDISSGRSLGQRRRLLFDKQTEPKLEPFLDWQCDTAQPPDAFEQKDVLVTQTERPTYKPMTSLFGEVYYIALENKTTRDSTAIL